MSNVPLIFQPLVKYVDFQGRARRSEFWLWVLFRFLVSAVAGTVAMSFMFTALSGVNWQANDPQAFMGPYMRIMPWINIINLVDLALLLPTLAVAVRRLHDINRTGWWLIMPVIVSVVGVIIALIIIFSQVFAAAGSGSNMTEAQTFAMLGKVFGSLALFVLLPILVSQIVMLVFYVTDGTPTANRFGADPKGRGVIDTPEVMF